MKNEDIERAAQAIYEHPDFCVVHPNGTAERRPENCPWVPGGNSEAQEQARNMAAKAIDAAAVPAVVPALLKQQKHVARVGELLAQFAAELIERAGVHDRSKFTVEELVSLARLDELIAAEGNVPFGSPEYEQRKKLLGPMLEHHYRENSHHPEHYSVAYGGNHEIGVEGMDLFDLMEMVVDWKAASERGEAPAIGLKAGCDKYKISLQLEKIMRNTVDRLGWKAD